MFCTTCGKNIEDTALFCVNCGSKVGGMPVQQQYAPVQQPDEYAQQKKRKKGLVIGLVAGYVVVLAASLLVYFFLLPGPNADVVGKWYDEYGYSTIEFLLGGKCKLNAVGMEFDATYTFDADSKKGEVTISFMGMEETASFSLSDKGILNIEGTEYSKTPVEQKGLDDILDDLNMDGIMPA